MMENHSMRVYCYVLVALFAFFLPSAVYAQSEISVDVEMDEYSLGDHIVFTLSVSKILALYKRNRASPKPTSDITSPFHNTTKSLNHDGSKTVSDSSIVKTSFDDMLPYFNTLRSCLVPKFLQNSQSVNYAR